ncbi:MAG TPA: sulfite exporter TauE/SafE family protein [Geminicoccaceae bacterium]|nr:sulfite exporter TauE/SafE family protein [Geminicoccaceae bacterium]
MIDDPAFYLAAIPAVLIFGISKGGFGGGLGIAAVPLMAIVVSPARAAGILLPLLVLMDLIGLFAYRRHWDRRVVKVMLPGALLGILIGGLAFGYLDDDVVRVVLGLIAVGFTADYFLRDKSRIAARPQRRVAGAFWGCVAGFTSTIAHAGGPPANIYLLPLKLDKSIFVGTMVVLFSAVNAAKIVPYASLGLFDAANLTTSLVLAPVAAIGMLAGIWLHGKVDQLLFYRLCYVFVLLTGLKLVYDGLT